MVDDREAPENKDLKISSRRYLGNKSKIAGRIRSIVDEYCANVQTFADVFAGTGAVAAAFADKQLITNDILYSNYICHVAWFSAEPYDRAKLMRMLAVYNAAQIMDDNYMSDTFADTYFSIDDCRRIGFIREDIERQFADGRINAHERALLITALLYAMDRIANTCGHYDAYRRGAAFNQRLELRLPSPPKNVSSANAFFNEDANGLVRRLSADVVFLDPPYNSRQYSDAYHVLENVARWEKPAVCGVARKMDRGGLKSDYCTRHAGEAFEDLICSIRARYIVLTYNNMGEQGNGRSNAKIDDDTILRVLKAKGKLRVFNVAHKVFSAGKSDRPNNVERIFLCTCNLEPLVESPINYTGGKFKVLPQMFPHFPANIRTFVDLFCGGCNVGANVVAKKVILSDACAPLVALLVFLQRSCSDEVIAKVQELVIRFGLSDSAANGYSPYGCESGAGLKVYNKERYMRLRDYYRSLADDDAEKSVALYALIVFAFNNQIRFNSRGGFNTPVGKRDFNAKMRQKLATFIKRLHERAFEVVCADFRNIDLASLGTGDFVYADPPYLVTTATYNENKGWSEHDEAELLALLDRLHGQGCGFALSNVTESKGRRNEILLKWLDRNRGVYRAIPIRRSYKNSNYHRTKDDVTNEILVVNV